MHALRCYLPTYLPVYSVPLPSSESKCTKDVAHQCQGAAPVLHCHLQGAWIEADSSVCLAESRKHSICPTPPAFWHLSEELESREKVKVTRPGPSLNKLFALLCILRLPLGQLIESARPSITACVEIPLMQFASSTKNTFSPLVPSTMILHVENVSRKMMNPTDRCVCVCAFALALD